MGSQEDRRKSNGARLSRLLIDKGTDAMRKSFDSIISSTALSATLSSNRTFLENLQRHRCISQCQMEILFPPSGAPSQSKDFDITLLFILLRHICGLHPPLSTSSWNENPPSWDNTRVANLARIKYYRNKVYGHITTTGVKDTDFESYWNDISAAVVGLGVSEGDVQRLKHSPLEENLFLNQIKEWKEKENGLEVILKEMSGALKALPLGQEEKLDAVMKETNTRLEAISQVLSDNQNETKTIVNSVFHENQKEAKALRELLLKAQQEMKQLQPRDSAVVEDKEIQQIEELKQTMRELKEKKRKLQKTNGRKQEELRERQYREETELSKRQRKEVVKQNERHYREEEELKKRQQREQEELKKRHCREQDELEKQHVKEQEEINERGRKDWEKQQEEEHRLEKQKQLLEKQRVRKRPLKEQNSNIIKQQQVEEQRQKKSEEQTTTKQQKLEERNSKEPKKRQKVKKGINIETDEQQRLEEHKRKEFEEPQRRLREQKRKEPNEQQRLEEKRKNSNLPAVRVNRRVTNKLQGQRLNPRPWSMIAYSEIQSSAMGEVPQHQTLPRSRKAQCNSVKDLIDEQWSMNQSYTNDTTSSKNSRDPVFLKIPFKNLNNEELGDDYQKLQRSWSMTSLAGDVSLSTSSTISPERIGNTAHTNNPEDIFDEQWDMNQSNTGEASSSKNSKDPKLKTFFKNVFKNLKQKKRGKNNQKLECSRSTANLPRTVSLSSSSSSSPNLTGSTGKSKPLRSKSLAIINK